MGDEPRLSGPKLLLVVLLIPAMIGVVTIVPILLHHRSPDVATPPSPAAPTQPPVPTAGTAAPTSHVTLAPPVPSPREETAMAYDSRRDDVVLFGGGAIGSEPPIGDTWTLDAHGWHPQHPAQSPPPLGGPVMAEDTASGTVLLIGGFPATAEAASTTLETWSWDGRTWSRRMNLPAPHEAAMGLAALPAMSELVLLTLVIPAGTGARTQTHTWTWDGAEWTLQHPRTKFPIGGATPTLASDPAHQRVVALLMGTYATDIQTWAWDGHSWSLLPTSASPSYDPITASMAPDPRSGDIILFVCGTYACDTWALSGLAWHVVDQPSPDIDTAYRAAQLLADTHIRRVIVVGREGPDRPNPFDTLWLFTGNEWMADPATALG